MSWSEVWLSILAGVTTAAIAAAAKLLWQRTKVPTVLSRAVDRRSYMRTILALSQDPDVLALEVISPGLGPSAGDDLIKQIQVAWAGINARHGARVITTSTRESLKAGAQLLSLGVQVRISNAIESVDLSYHLFTLRDDSVSIINHKENAKDRPVRLNGVAPARVFQSNFAEIWEAATPIESVLTEAALGVVRERYDFARVVQRVRELRAVYDLDQVSEGATLVHVAFRQQAPVIFVVGLPGAGKSLVRRKLADKMRQLRFQVEELSDYVFAFRDFIHGAILLDESRGSGFRPAAGGAFAVDNEVYLRPALHALAERVWANQSTARITIVEFARADIISALREFGDEVLRHSHLLHVDASAEVRERRLAQRAQPPDIQVDQLNINVVVSDDHRLPSTVAESLYDADDIAALLRDRNLASRVYRIDNNADDPSGARIDRSLDDFITSIARPYLAGDSALPILRQWRSI